MSYKEEYLAYEDEEITEPEQNEGGYSEHKTVSDEEWEAIPEELRPFHEDSIVVSKRDLEEYDKLLSHEIH